MQMHQLPTPGLAPTAIGGSVIIHSMNSFRRMGILQRMGIQRTGESLSLSRSGPARRARGRGARPGRPVRPGRRGRAWRCAPLAPGTPGSWEGGAAPWTLRARPGWRARRGIGARPGRGASRGRVSLLVFAARSGAPLPIRGGSRRDMPIKYKKVS